MEEKPLKIIKINEKHTPRLLAVYDEASSPLDLNWITYLGNNMIFIGKDDNGFLVYAVPMKKYFRGFLPHLSGDVVVAETDHTAWALVNVYGDVTPEMPIETNALVYWHGDTWDGDIGHLPEEVRKI